MNTEEIKFLSKLTASMTHEIRNVFTITQEACGLISDLLDFSDEKIGKEKLEKILSKIQNQTERGIKLINYLNRLSHLYEEPFKNIDLIDILDLIAGLTRHLMSSKQVKLELKTSSFTPLKVNTSPFYLSMAIYYSLDFFLTVLNPGESITLETWYEDGFAELRIYGKRTDTDSKIEDPTPYYSIIKKCIQKAKGSLQFRKSPLEIAFKIPSNR